MITAISPRARLSNVYNTAESIALSRPNSIFSFMKVENVVKPPQNPVTNINFVLGKICPPNDNPDSIPIRKQPITLTAIVPQGKTTGRRVAPVNGITVSHD